MIQSKAVQIRRRVFFRRKISPVLSVVEWSPGLYAVENNRMYYLVQVNEMVPPGPVV
jgi:hypothetical protein